MFVMLNFRLSFVDWNLMEIEELSECRREASNLELHQAVRIPPEVLVDGW